ncbi:MAG: hypothetical protein V1649_01970 [Patescibacteria group bacterium]
MEKENKIWKFKNTIMLFLSIILIAIFINTPFIKNIIHSIGELGFFGIFLTGIFFVSTFTVVPAGIVLFFLARELNPFIIAIIAGLGAVLGDYLIFRFLKDKIFEELKPIFEKFRGPRLLQLLATPYFAWLAPVLGAIIIASPFPDEIGIGLMGLSKLKNWQFLLISFVLNSVGILIIITFANLAEIH